jgi:hypothetical protein
MGIPFVRSEIRSGCAAGGAQNRAKVSAGPCRKGKRKVVRLPHPNPMIASILLLLLLTVLVATQPESQGNGRV